MDCLDGSCDCCCGECPVNYLGEKIIGNFKTPRKHKNSAKETRKDPKHIEWLHSLPCCVSGSMEDVIAHHLLLKEDRGVGMKAQDMYAVPLNAELHVQLHHEVPKVCSEWEWFSAHGVKFHKQLAERLYRNSGDSELAEVIIRMHRT